MALSHVVMHFALCSAAARLGPQAELPVHLVVTDKIGRDVIDKTARILRYEGNTSSVEFDMPWGLYRASATMRVGRATCSGVQFFSVLQDHNRAVTINLQNGIVHPPAPTIIQGTAPFAFSYVDPTVMVFGPDTKCNAAVGNPLGVNIEQQSDADGFYAYVYPQAGLPANSQFAIALRLTDSRGGYHYLRVPGNFLTTPSPVWPSLGQINVTEDVIDYVADKPEDTLLCPREYETEVH